MSYVLDVMLFGILQPNSQNDQRNKKKTKTKLLLESDHNGIYKFAQIKKT